MASPVPAATRAPAAARPKTPAQLAAMELNGTESVQAYAYAARAIHHQLAMEMEVTAHELSKRLERVGGSMGDRFAARRAARQVVRRLRRSAAHSNAAADECLRFWRDYLKTYEPLINPQRKGTAWNWQK